MMTSRFDLAAATISHLQHHPSIMKYLALLLLLPSLSLAQNFVDLCEEYSSSCCFNDDGSQETTYWFVETTNDPNQHELDCLLVSDNARLAVLDTVQKNDCMVRYIRDVGETATAEHQHWAPGSPNEGDTDAGACAYMTVGEDYYLSGFWEDTSCTTAGFYAICEEYVE